MATSARRSSLPFAGSGRVAELTVIQWRDIPAQVTCGAGRRATRAVLSDRFQEAIDAAAMAAGLSGTDGYLEEWRRVTRTVDGDDDAAVAAEVARLETEYTDDILARLVRTRGLTPEGDM
jgi:Virulence factor